MMVAQNNGGPAFPSGESFRDVVGNTHAKGPLHAGMTLRDYFAAQALSGMCGGVPGSHLVPPNAAREAYTYADEMLAARDGGPTHHEMRRLLREWLGIDDWSDDTIAPKDLVERTRRAVEARK